MGFGEDESFAWGRVLGVSMPVPNFCLIEDDVPAWTDFPVSRIKHLVKFTFCVVSQEEAPNRLAFQFRPLFFWDMKVCQWSQDLKEIYSRFNSSVPFFRFYPVISASGAQVDEEVCYVD